MQAATDYIVQLEQKCFDANRTSLDLMQTVRTLEKEVDTLKAYVTDLRCRLAVYIPTKTDAIDVALAAYMNSYPDKRKIKIMFIR